MIIDGQGAYAGPNGQSVVCTVTPYTQDYLVSYSGQYISKNLNGKQPAYPQNAPLLSGTAYIALFGLELVFLYGQSGIHNVIGDSLTAISNDEIVSTPLTKLWVTLFLYSETQPSLIRLVGSIHNGCDRIHRHGKSNLIKHTRYVLISSHSGNENWPFGELGTPWRENSLQYDTKY